MYFAKRNKPSTTPSEKASVIEENVPKTRFIIHIKTNPTKFFGRTGTINEIIEIKLIVGNHILC